MLVLNEASGLVSKDVVVKLADQASLLGLRKYSHLYQQRRRRRITYCETSIKQYETVRETGGVILRRKLRRNRGILYLCKETLGLTFFETRLPTHPPPLCPPLSDDSVPLAPPSAPVDKVILPVSVLPTRLGRQRQWIQCKIGDG